VQPFNPEHIYPNEPVDLSPRWIARDNGRTSDENRWTGSLAQHLLRALVCGPVLSQKRGRYPTIPTSLYFGSGRRHL